MAGGPSLKGANVSWKSHRQNKHQSWIQTCPCADQPSPSEGKGFDKVPHCTLATEPVSEPNPLTLGPPLDPNHSLQRGQLRVSKGPRVCWLETQGPSFHP